MEEIKIISLLFYIIGGMLVIANGYIIYGITQRKNEEIRQREIIHNIEEKMNTLIGEHNRNHRRK